MNDEMTEGTQETAKQDESQTGGPVEPTEGDELTQALEDTLNNLNASIERMEDLVHRLESGEGDWEESVRLLSEANDLAMQSSQQLDRAVQDVMYGSEEAGEAGAQEKLPLDHEEESQS